MLNPYTCCFGLLTLSELRHTKARGESAQVRHPRILTFSSLVSPPLFFFSFFTKVSIPSLPRASEVARRVSLYRELLGALLLLLLSRPILRRRAVPLAEIRLDARGAYPHVKGRPTRRPITIVSTPACVEKKPEKPQPVLKPRTCVRARVRARVCVCVCACACACVCVCEWMTTPHVPDAPAQHAPARHRLYFSKPRARERSRLDRPRSQTRITHGVVGFDDAWNLWRRRRQ